MRNRRIVIFMEDHFRPEHRALGARLLPVLAAAGATHFALETNFQAGLDLFAATGVPTPGTEVFGFDPQRAALLRTARRCGLRPVAFDMDLRNRPPARDEAATAAFPAARSIHGRTSLGADRHRALLHLPALRDHLAAGTVPSLVPRSPGTGAPARTLGHRPRGRRGDRPPAGSARSAPLLALPGGRGDFRPGAWSRRMPGASPGHGRNSPQYVPCPANRCPPGTGEAVECTVRSNLSPKSLA